MCAQNSQEMASGRFRILGQFIRNGQIETTHQVVPAFSPGIATLPAQA
jgi:hypothetical protein